MKIYKCPHCGNVLIAAVDSQVVPVCCGDPVKAVYEYCNLHGLWVSEQ